MTASQPVPGPPLTARFGRSVGTGRVRIGVGALAAWALLLAPRPALGQDPSVIPLGADEAASVVDRFVELVNRGAAAELEALLTPDARWAGYDYGVDRLAEQTYLPRFWQLPLLQLRFPGYPPSLPAGDSVRLTVVQRLASGSVVIQRELWSRGPAGAEGVEPFHALAVYKLRAGRIHRVWYLPTQDVDVPAGVRPAAAGCRDPVVWFDAAHGNTSTPDGLYALPASVLRAAGYEVRMLVDAPLTAALLDSLTTLVTANPLPAEYADPASDTADPPASAFTEGEIDAVDAWVRSGGRLLLIADHDPWPAASAALAARFGAAFLNGAAVDTTRPRGGGDRFSRSDGTLRAHPITDGLRPGERVDSVRTFLGQAFAVEPPLEPLLVLHDGMKLAPPGALAGDPSSWMPVGGLAQAAAGAVGAGRVVVMGEAWAFRFLDPSLGAGNTRFLLNVMSWLTDQTCPP